MFKVIFKIWESFNILKKVWKWNHCQFVILWFVSEHFQPYINIVKTKLHNKIKDEFFMDSLIVYIEREVAATISIDSI